MKEKKSSNPANLQFFSRSTIEQIQIEITRVSQLYKSDQIDSIKAKKMLHQASQDIKIFSRLGSAMIRQERKKIDFIRKVKKSMDQELPDDPELEDVSFEEMEVKKITS